MLSIGPGMIVSSMEVELSDEFELAAPDNEDQAAKAKIALEVKGTVRVELRIILTILVRPVQYDPIAYRKYRAFRLAEFTIRLSV